MKSEAVTLINKCGYLSAYRKVGTEVYRVLDGTDALVLMTAGNYYTSLREDIQNSVTSRQFSSISAYQNYHKYQLQLTINKLIKAL